MRPRDIIFYLLLQVALALFLFMLSMSAQASSNSQMHDQGMDYGHQEFTPVGEDHMHHGQEAHHGKKTDQHFDKDTGHDTSQEAGDHMDNDHQTEVPLVYLFYWGILILVMVIILIYFVYRYKRSQSEPVIPLAVFLVLFGLSIYILEISAPTFSGRFDLATLKVVHEFHEGTDLGFLRFIYKFILGIFMTFFAFLNLDRKGLKP